MADGPWTKYQAAAPSAPKAVDSGASGPWTKYAGKSAAPTDTGPPVALADEPGKEYGAILPFSRDVKTGKTELAFPQVIRGPVQVASRATQEMFGERPVSTRTALEGALMAAPGSAPFAAKGLAREAPAAVQALKDAPHVAEATAAEKAAEKAASVKPGAKTAHEAGFVLPPAVATEKPGIVGKLAAGESGKVKLFQEASIKNQARANELAAQSVGLPEGTQLTEEAFKAIRDQAGQAYNAVREYVPEIKWDRQFEREIRDIGGANSAVAKLFPKTTKNAKINELKSEVLALKDAPTDALMEYVKILRSNAKQNFKALGKPEQHALALSQDRAARAIDDLIDRNVSNADKYFGERVNALGKQETQAAQRLNKANQALTNANAKLTQTRGNVYGENSARRAQETASKEVVDAQAELESLRAAKQQATEQLRFVQSDAGKTELVQKYRDARTLIAKTHALEAVTNPVTGDVSARGLARLQDGGAPLTDELKQIADSATAFPKAFQTPAQIGGKEPLSVLDFAYMAGAAAAHHPAAGIMSVMRAPARSMLLSPGYQRSMFGDLDRVLGSQSGIEDILKQVPPSR